MIYNRVSLLSPGSSNNSLQSSVYDYLQSWYGKRKKKAHPCTSQDPEVLDYENSHYPIFQVICQLLLVTLLSWKRTVSATQRWGHLSTHMLLPSLKKKLWCYLWARELSKWRTMRTWSHIHLSLLLWTAWLIKIITWTFCDSMFTKAEHYPFRTCNPCGMNRWTTTY